jgi:hypothetical protein
MRDDIKNLPIENSELAKLTNLYLFDLFHNLLDLSSDRSALRLFFLFPILLFLMLPKYQEIGILSEGYIIFSISFAWSLFSWLNFKKYINRPPLKGLLKDVKRFNSLIKSIHIIDQMEEAGNLSVKLKDRERIIEALKLIREDLCRALKTERILRENKKFISRNPALFENNLIALTTLQVDDQASEQGRLLDEALQIALSTQEELRRFQKRDY